MAFGKGTSDKIATNALVKNNAENCMMHRCGNMIRIKHAKCFSASLSPCSSPHTIIYGVYIRSLVGSTVSGG